MGDDGVGYAVADLLEPALPPETGVRVVRGDTDALRLVSWWRGEAEVWLVDAVRSGAPPGTVHRLTHQELLAVPQGHRDAHRLSLPECLRWLALATPELAGVRYRFWGIEVERIGPAVGLSPAVAAAAAQVAAEVVAEASGRRAG